MAEREKHAKYGDVVIHERDEKRPENLMRVIGYSRDRFGGSVITVYRDRESLPHICSPSDLHDPARFGIDTGGRG